MNRQRGMGLFGLFSTLVMLGIVAVLVLKLLPAFTEYAAIKKDIKTIAAGGADKPIPTLQTDFDKYALIDGISAIQGKDLDISKGKGTVRISFAYEKRIPLVSNVSLMIVFKHATVGY